LPAAHGSPLSSSRDGDSNIGDKGLTGVEEFKRQHKCNSICQKIGLKPVLTTSDAPASKLESSPPLVPQSGGAQFFILHILLSLRVLEEPRPQAFHVRLGCGVINCDPTSSTTDCIPRGYTRYSGAAFNHILGIEAGEETTVYGPFDTKLVSILLSSLPSRVEITQATLRYSRRKDSKDVLLLDFSKRKQSDEIDYPTQEVTRFADAKDLMEQFETLLEAKHFSLESNPESTDSTYCSCSFKIFTFVICSSYFRFITSGIGDPTSQR
jgi:hypothetical protein